MTWAIFKNQKLKKLSFIGKNYPNGSGGVREILKLSEKMMRFQ